MISYFKCGHCGFIQTEEPWWLEEAYKSAIAFSDTGILMRNRKFSDAVTMINKTYFSQNAKYLDYSGGYGILCRMMRDNGYDFYWSDPYCENLFARGFEHNPGTNYKLITAFESFEHFTNPIQEIRKMFSLAENILFTTRLLPGDKIPERSWWYYSFENGQHVSLYTYSSLEVLAKHFGKNLYTNYRNMHLFTGSRLVNGLFAYMTYSYYFIPKFIIKAGLHSKTHSDMQLLNNYTEVPSIKSGRHV